MPRNGSGTFSLATTFTPDTDALAEDVNTQFEDIRDAITGSVAADGQTTITGALKGADGSATAPGYGFGSDANTGIYRIGADTIGIAAGGAEIARVGTAGVTVASGKTLTVGGSSVTAIPSGVICMWSGSVASIPSGWYLCDGANSTPDLRDKFIIGAKQDDTGVAKTNVTGALTQSGGSKDAVNVSHTHTATSVVTDPGHTHTTTVFGTLGGASLALQDRSSSAGATTSSSSTTGVTVATTNSTEGVSGTNQNLPPYYALAFIMKA